MKTSNDDAEIKFGGDNTAKFNVPPLCEIKFTPPKIKAYKLFCFQRDWGIAKSEGVKWYQYVWGYDIWADKVPMFKTMILGIALFEWFMHG